MNPRGSLLLPRPLADRGAANWPKCALCLRAVDRYGIENETARSIEIWAECSGVRIDPATGTVAWILDAHGRPVSAPKKHETMRSSVTIAKTAGWSMNRFVDIVRRLAFFAPEGERKWVQDLTAQAVRPKS